MLESTHLRAIVSSRRDLIPELWIVRLRPEEELAFLPGQYITIGLPGGARLVVERPYSVASTPRERELEFFVELGRSGRYGVPLIVRFRTAAPHEAEFQGNPRRTREHPD
ncbi:MAG: hypothetical protein ACLP59_07320 [Bryobacteraceae bacterium]